MIEELLPLALDPAADRARFLEELARLGPRYSTTVVLNGRTLLLDGALNLIEHLPEDAQLRHRGRHVTVDPDPFGSHYHAERPELPSTHQLVRRLIECQRETDRAAAPSWWQRAKGWLAAG